MKGQAFHLLAGNWKISLLPSKCCNTRFLQLSEKEQLILSMYYQHEMNLKEIALVLGLTEARICQLNKQIAQKIRDFVYPN